ncbi:MAG: YceI family protein [Chitinophagaceae bacterium]|nr:YceI family protein [Oligoflexus sp.]
MFSHKSLLSSAAGLLLATSVFAAAPKKYEAATYQIDPSHSKVGFEIPHLVISSVEGRFNKFDGTLVLNDAFEKSTFKANVDVVSVDTGEKKRDEHLASPDFFDAKKFPAMTFESTEVKGSPEDFKLTGNLTIHGVTKKVTFDSKYLGTVADGYGNQKVAFHGKAKINRKDFGLVWSKAVEAGPVVGDEVDLNLSIQAAKPGKK